MVSDKTIAAKINMTKRTLYRIVQSSIFQKRFFTYSEHIPKAKPRPQPILQ